MHTKSGRRKQFRAALALSGQTQEAWATSHGLSASHVSQVLTGKRESLTLVEKVDAFIARAFPLHRAAS